MAGKARKVSRGGIRASAYQNVDNTSSRHHIVTYEGKINGTSKLRHRKVIQLYAQQFSGREARKRC